MPLFYYVSTTLDNQKREVSGIAECASSEQLAMMLAKEGCLVHDIRPATHSDLMVLKLKRMRSKAMGIPLPRVIRPQPVQKKSYTLYFIFMALLIAVAAILIGYLWWNKESKNAERSIDSSGRSGWSGKIDSGG